MVRVQLKYLVKWLLIGFAMSLLSGCKYSMINPAGSIASSQKDLIITALILMLLVVVPVIILTLLFSWRYRASNTNAKYMPNWGHNNWLEFTWWAIPCLIILALAIITFISSYRLDPYRPIDPNKKPLQIQVVAMNWKWLFIYPEQNVATVNYLKIPVHQPVKFVITSDGPMNSFWIPAIGGQIMAMPGMQTQLYEKADKISVSEGASANISGAGFSTMHFNISAVSNDDFKQWISQVKKSSLTLNSASYTILAKPSGNNPETDYVLKDKHLFSSIVMKYMKPGGMHQPMNKNQAKVN